MLCQRLYGLRKGRGMSQEQLAERIGVSRQTISKWETGQSTPDLEKLTALAECFGVTLDALAGRAEPAQTPPETPPEVPTRRKARLLAGISLCTLGLVCLIVSVAASLLFPQAMAPIAGSVAVTIDGQGLVFGLCILAVVSGVFVLLRQE